MLDKKRVLRELQTLVTLDPLAASQALTIISNALEAFKTNALRANSANATTAIDACVHMPSFKSWKVTNKRHRDGARLVAVGLGLHLRDPASQYEKELLSFCLRSAGVDYDDAKGHLRIIGGLGLLRNLEPTEEEQCK